MKTRRGWQGQKEEVEEVDGYEFMRRTRGGCEEDNEEHLTRTMVICRGHAEALEGEEGVWRYDEVS